MKILNFTIDIAIAINPANFFQIFRGDNVKFSFDFKQDGQNLSLENIEKLRIYAKRIRKCGYPDIDENPLFAKEIELTTEQQAGHTLDVEISSSETASDSADYALVVMLLESDDKVFTTQMLNFHLVENGYSGIYQPSEDFRDEVLDAVADAEQARDEAQQARDDSQAHASAAYSSEQSALGYSQSANASAQASAQSASLANEAKDAAITAQNNAQTFATSAQQSADASQESAERAEEIVEQAEQTFDVASFVRRGELWFKSGRITTTYIPNLTSPFSVCLNLTLTEDDLKSWVSGMSVIGTGGTTSQTNGFFLCKTQSSHFEFNTRTNYATKSIRIAEYNASTQSYTSQYLDGLPHNYVISYDGINIHLYIDGAEFGGALTPNWSDVVLPQSFRIGNYYQNGNITAKISRIKYFNFDITADDAPYTLQDYISGKDEPPSLHNAYNLSNISNWTSATNYDTSLTMSASSLTISQQSASSLFYTKIATAKPVKSGQILQIAISGTSSANLYAYKVLTANSANMDSLLQESAQTNIGDSLTFDITANANYVGVMLAFTNLFTTGATATINIAIKQDGALLSLSDYTVQDGASRKIFDNSGQGDHATITGDVNGTHDNAIANLINFITQQV